jgi:hypothetical protein
MSTLRVKESATVGNDKYIEAESVLYTNGLFVTSVRSRSKHWTEGLRGRVFCVLADTQGRALWVSKFNVCKTCGGRSDLTTPSAQSDVFQETIPEAVAQVISSIDVFEFNDAGQDWRQQLAQNIKKNVEMAEGIYNSLPPEVKTAILVSLA